MKSKQRRLTSGSDWEALTLAFVLILTGFVLLAGDAIGVLSLDRIQNYWPVALITFGLIELGRAQDDRPAVGGR